MAFAQIASLTTPVSGAMGILFAVLFLAIAGIRFFTKDDKKRKAIDTSIRAVGVFSILAWATLSLTGLGEIGILAFQFLNVGGIAIAESFFQIIAWSTAAVALSAISINGVLALNNALMNLTGKGFTK